MAVYLLAWNTQFRDGLPIAVPIRPTGRKERRFDVVWDERDEVVHAVVEGKGLVAKRVVRMGRQTSYFIGTLGSCMGIYHCECDDKCERRSHGLIFFLKKDRPCQKLAIKETLKLGNFA